MHRLIGSRNGSNNAQTYCERARDTGRKEERRGSTQRIEPEKRGGEKRESKSIEQKESERERESSRKPLLIFISSARSSQLLVVAVRRCVVIGYVSF